MTFYVENETDETFQFPIDSVANLVAKEVLIMEKCPYDVEIELSIVDEETIKQYNKEYRNIDKVTDVLSFPGIEFEKESDFSVVECNKNDYLDPDTKELVLGNIMICAKRLKEQAVNYGHSEKREYAFLVAHSLLHLCGYDHMDEIEAKRMEDKQESVLKNLGIGRETISS